MTTISSIDARAAQANIGRAGDMVTASVANLVSGTRANASVADLSVGTVLANRVGTLRVALSNAGQAKSLLETAKGALDTLLGLLQDQKNLAVKSADDSLSDNERGFLNQEFVAITSEINRISENTNFNGKALLDGSISGKATVATATGLESENYGIINAGGVELKGTVATGDLSTTTSERGVNRVIVTTAAASGTSGTFTVTNGLPASDGLLTATVTFSSGADINSTIDNLVAAFNDLTATDDAEARVAQNFRLVNNGDNSFSIEGKEGGTHLKDHTFQLATAITAATMGMDASGSDVVGGALAFTTDSAITGTDTSIGVEGTFTTIAAYNVGETQTSAELSISGFTDTDDETYTLTLEDEAGVLGAADATVVITLTNNGTATTADQIIDALMDVMNGGVTSASDLRDSAQIDGLTIGGTATAAHRALILNSFILERTNASTTTSIGKLTTARNGIEMDNFNITLASSNAGNIVATLGANDVESAMKFTAGTEMTTGALRSTSTTEATVNANLIGGFSNFKATFHEAATGYRNYATFSVEINNRTYISDKVYLFGGATATDLGLRGNQIAANTDIFFHDPDGPKTTNGDLTDNIFVLKTGTSAVTLTDMSDSAKARESLTTIADAFQTQLASTTINQDRSLKLEQVEPSNGDHRIKAAVGTILDGIRGFDSVGTNVANFNQGDIRIITSDYSSTGTLGDVGKFDVDRLTNKITTTVDGKVYTAYLSSDDLPSEGNAIAFGTNLDGTSNVGAYNTTTKIFDLQDGTTSTAALSVTGQAKLHFFSASTTDGKVLVVDLGNVSDNTAQIDVSTAAGEQGLEGALNAIFGVSSSESLSFQVGADASDTIGVSISSSKTTDIYKDNSDVVQSISVDTIENAIAAGDVLDNAINSVIALISDIAAKITSFDSSIQNNEASIQNADAARSNLLDTDYSSESTKFAEARVRVDAAAAILSQVNARIQNLLQLLQQ